MSEFDYSLLGQYGKDVYISANVEIKRPHLVSVGSHIAIDSYLYCTTAMMLGSYIHISPHVSIIGGADGTLWVESFCTISAGVRIIVRGDEMHGTGLVGPIIPDRYRDIVRGKNIAIHRFSSIGSNAVLMPDVTIAEGVVVGAGAIVTKSIMEPWTIWAGVPARRIKNRVRTKMPAYAEELMKNE